MLYGGRATHLLLVDAVRGQYENTKSRLQHGNNAPMEIDSIKGAEGDTSGSQVDVEEDGEARTVVHHRVATR